MSAKKPPADLEAVGAKLWRDVLAAYELRADELPVLLAACRLLDELKRLEQDLDRIPATMIVGSKGQPRINPLYAEARAHRLALAKMLQQLGLDEVNQVSPGLERSAAGRKMAILRWRKRA